MPKKVKAVPPAASPVEVVQSSFSTVPMPEAKSDKKKKFDRSDYTFAVWIGNSNTPKFWAKNENDIPEMLAKIKNLKIDNVHVGQVKKVSISLAVKSV